MATKTTKTANKSLTGNSMDTNNDWQIVSLDVLREKYAKGDEQELNGPDMVQAIRKRVANALAKQEKDPKTFEIGRAHV